MRAKMSDAGRAVWQGRALVAADYGEYASTVALGVAAETELRAILAETDIGDCVGPAGDFAIPMMHARILAESLRAFVEAC